MIIGNDSVVVYDNDMTHAPWRSIVVNSFGSLGYMSIIIQWTWCFITLGYPLFSSDHAFLLPQAPIPETRTPVDFGEFTPFIGLLAIFIAVLVTILSVVIVIRLPKTIGEKGAMATHVVARQVVKQTHRQRPIAKQERDRLSYSIVWALKGFAIAIPVALLFSTPAIEGLTTQLITTLGIVCGAFSLFYFSTQLLLAVMLKVNKNKVW